MKTMMNDFKKTFLINPLSDKTSRFWFILIVIIYGIGSLLSGSIKQVIVIAIFTYIILYILKLTDLQRKR